MKLELDYKLNIMNGVLMIYESFKKESQLAEEVIDAIINEYVDNEQYEEAAVVVNTRVMVQESTNDRNCTLYPRDPEI